MPDTPTGSSRPPASPQTNLAEPSQPDLDDHDDLSATSTPARSSVETGHNICSNPLAVPTLQTEWPSAADRVGVGEATFFGENDLATASEGGAASSWMSEDGYNADDDEGMESDGDGPLNYKRTRARLAATIAKVSLHDLPPDEELEVLPVPDEESAEEGADSEEGGHVSIAPSFAPVTFSDGSEAAAPPPLSALSALAAAAVIPTSPRPVDPQGGTRTLILQYRPAGGKSKVDLPKLPVFKKEDFGLTGSVDERRQRQSLLSAYADASRVRKKAPDSADDDADAVGAELNELRFDLAEQNRLTAEAQRTAEAARRAAYNDRAALRACERKVDSLEQDIKDLDERHFDNVLARRMEALKASVARACDSELIRIEQKRARQAEEKRRWKSVAGLSGLARFEELDKAIATVAALESKLRIIRNAKKELETERRHAGDPKKAFRRRNYTLEEKIRELNGDERTESKLATYQQNSRGTRTPQRDWRKQLKSAHAQNYKLRRRLEDCGVKLDAYARLASGNEGVAGDASEGEDVAEDASEGEDEPIGEDVGKSVDSHETSLSVGPGAGGVGGGAHPSLQDGEAEMMRSRGGALGDESPVMSSVRSGKRKAGAGKGGRGRKRQKGGFDDGLGLGSEGGLASLHDAQGPGSPQLDPSPADSRARVPPPTPTSFHATRRGAVKSAPARDASDSLVASATRTPAKKSGGGSRKMKQAPAAAAQQSLTPGIVSAAIVDLNAGSAVASKSGSVAGSTQDSPALSTASTLGKPKPSRQRTRTHIHPPVFNPQAPTPRNWNGTAPGATDFAPPGGGPTAREAAAAFEGDDDNPHPCPIVGCGKEFRRKSEFLHHYRVHTGERPFVCEYPGCGKSYISHSGLTVHQRIHSSDKAHACQDCGRRFDDSSALCLHRRIHVGFPCEMCGTKSFSRKGNLTRHQNTCRGRPGGDGVEGVDPLLNNGAFDEDDNEDESGDQGRMPRSVLSLAASSTQIHNPDHALPAATPSLFSHTSANSYSYSYQPPELALGPVKTLGSLFAIPSSGTSTSTSSPLPAFGLYVGPAASSSGLNGAAGLPIVGTVVRVGGAPATALGGAPATALGGAGEKGDAGKKRASRSTWTAERALKEAKELRRLSLKETHDWAVRGSRHGKGYKYAALKELTDERYADAKAECDRLGLKVKPYIWKGMTQGTARIRAMDREAAKLEEKVKSAGSEVAFKTGEGQAKASAATDWTRRRTQQRRSTMSTPKRLLRRPLPAI
ncbi:hypothetical protein JCM10296v2_000706 [Rhodotorula toruloides]